MEDVVYLPVEAFFEIKNQPITPGKIANNVINLKKQYGCFDHETNVQLFKKHEKHKPEQELWNQKKYENSKKVYKKIENTKTNNKRFVLACINKVSDQNIDKMTEMIKKHLNLLDEIEHKKSILDFILKKSCSEPGYLEQYMYIVKENYDKEEIQHFAKENAINVEWLRGIINTCLIMLEKQHPSEFTFYKHSLIKKNTAHVFWIRSGYLNPDEYLDFLHNCVTDHPEETHLFVDMLHEFFRQDKNSCNIVQRFKHSEKIKKAISLNKKSKFQVQDMFS